MRSFFSIAAKVFEFNQVEDQRPDFFKSAGLLNLAPYPKKGVILFLEAEQVRHLAPWDLNAMPMPTWLCRRLAGRGRFRVGHGAERPA